jgi:hypothetical protein
MHMRRIFTLIVVVLGIGVAVLFSYPQFKNIEKRGDANAQLVEGLVGVSIDRVAYAIQKTWTPRPRAENKFDHFQLAKPGDFYFPDDDQLKKLAVRDHLIRRYLALSSGLRSNDFSLTAFPNFYWPSEYFYNNTQAKFRCNFIIHLQPRSNTGTNIEILEYEPQIWVGNKIGVSAHTGPVPGVFYDIRDVDPTTLDRVELLGWIKKGISPDK